MLPRIELRGGATTEPTFYISTNDPVDWMEQTDTGLAAVIAMRPINGPGGQPIEVSEDARLSATTLWRERHPSGTHWSKLGVIVEANKIVNEQVPVLS